MATRMTFNRTVYPTADPRILPIGTRIPDGYILDIDEDYILISADAEEYACGYGTWTHTDGTPVEYEPTANPN